MANNLVMNNISIKIWSEVQSGGEGDVSIIVPTTLEITRNRNGIERTFKAKLHGTVEAKKAQAEKIIGETLMAEALLEIPNILVNTK